MKRTTFSALLILTVAAPLTACQPPALASSTSTPGLSVTPTVYLPTAARGASLTPTAEHLVTIGQARPEAPIRPLLGVNAGPVPAGDSGNPDLTAAYQQIGVTQVRTHDFYGPLDMAIMYPDRTRDPADPNSYDFAAGDAVWTAIVAGGFEPYLRLGDSWNNATPPSGPAERANWVRAAVEVVRHYREGQWDGFVSNLRYVEIWNEPDYQQFWPRPHTRLEFFQLFAETAQALKTAFPDLLVGGPGLAPAGCKTSQGQQYTEEFLAYLQGHDVPLDFFSWHMYSNDPVDFAAAATFYRDLLEATGYAAAESHITEWNTGIRDGDSPAEKLALRAGAKGAALMTAAWIGLQEQGIDRALFYRGTDATLQNPSWYGLFYADGRPKRMALAFSLWSQVAAHPEQLSLSMAPANDTPSALAAVAGRNTAGEIALLVVNPTATSTTWRLAFADGRDLGGYALTVHEVSDAHEQVHVFTPSGTSLNVGAYTIQLVLLSPR